MNTYIIHTHIIHIYVHTYIHTHIHTYMHTQYTQTSTDLEDNAQPVLKLTKVRAQLYIIPNHSAFIYLHTNSIFVHTWLHYAMIWHIHHVDVCLFPLNISMCTRLLHAYMIYICICPLYCHNKKNASETSLI
jgi:hypothetical protein